MNNHEIKHPCIQLRFHTEVQEAVGSSCSDLYSQMHLDLNYCSTVRTLLEDFDQLEWADIRLWKLRTNTAQDPFSYCVFQLSALSLSEPDGVVCLLYPLKWVGILDKIYWLPQEISFSVLESSWFFTWLKPDSDHCWGLLSNVLILRPFTIYTWTEMCCDRSLCLPIVVYIILYCISYFGTMTGFTTDAFWWLFREAVVAYIMWITWFLGMNEVYLKKMFYIVNTIHQSQDKLYSGKNVSEQ